MMENFIKTHNVKWDRSQFKSKDDARAFIEQEKEKAIRAFNASSKYNPSGKLKFEAHHVTYPDRIAFQIYKIKDLEDKQKKPTLEESIGEAIKMRPALRK